MPTSLGELSKLRRGISAALKAAEAEKVYSEKQSGAKTTQMP
jgi:hypothetical protein